MPQEISIEEFQKMVLKTATVVQAEAVPESKNLIRCVVEIGDTKRQIVAGIGQHYEAKDLIGKNIIVVENLKPATIRGVESQGMLLAVDGKEGIVLLVPEKPVASGQLVK